MSRFSSQLLLCIMVFFSFEVASAQTASKWSSGYDWTQRSSNREKGRWSLSDWLAIKDHSRQEDMWLSTNTPNPYEFILSGSYLSYTNDTSGGGNASTSKSYTNYSGEFSAYAGFAGLTGEFADASNDGHRASAGMFNLRVFGNSVQNTSLTLSYGLRTSDISGTNATTLRQQFGQADLQLYITKYFGIEGKYRYFLPTTNDQLGSVKEDYTEAGAFIDFKFLRVFGAWFKENQKYKVPSATDDTVTDRTGIRSGIKLFF